LYRLKVREICSIAPNAVAPLCQRASKAAELLMPVEDWPADNKNLFVVHNRT